VKQRGLHDSTAERANAVSGRYLPFPESPNIRA
jgi:hypothetical protein